MNEFAQQLDAWTQELNPAQRTHLGADDNGRWLLRFNPTMPVAAVDLQRLQNTQARYVQLFGH